METRSFTIDRAKANGDSTFPVTLSTETPYLRHYGYEVLDHENVDLSRAPLPLIESHDQTKVNIGIVEHLRVESSKLRGEIRLGKSARAKELAQDIEAGIVRNVSIGYSIGEGKPDGDIDGEPVYRFPFSPHELSLVAAPADIQSGIYRSNTMENNTETLSRSDRKRNNQALEDEQERVKCISSMAEAHDELERGMKAINDGTSYQDFNRDLCNVLGNRDTSSRREVDTIGANAAGMATEKSLYGRHIENYSITRILRGLSDPTHLSDCGLELEISQDMKRQHGKQTQGVLVPWEALATRAVTAGGTGGNLIATEHLAGRFIDVLRARSVVMSLNPTMLTGLVGDVVIPKKTSGSTGYWIAGDHSDAITESDIALGQVTLSPKTVGGAVTFSHKMIVQSSPDIEQLVRTDLADMLAVEIDLKAINGDGTGNTPTGIINTSGISSNTSAAANPTFAEIIQLETDLGDANADMGQMSYLMTPAIKGAFRGTEKFSGSGQSIWEPGVAANSVNGHPAHTSGNVPANTVIFADWTQLLIGFWGGIELAVDPYGTNFLKGSVSVRAMADVDCAVRHPEAFSLTTNP